MSKIRFQMDIDESQNKELESLMEECRIKTKKDLINNALTLFKWAVNKRKGGYEIGAIKGESFTELDMPALPAVTKLP